MNNNYLNILGLAHRAGACISGEERVVHDLKRRQIKLLLLANDIGKQTKKKLTDKCKTYQIPYVVVDDRYTLGKSIGKAERVAIGITNDGFARKIQSLFQV